MAINSSLFEETIQIDTGKDYIFGTLSIPGDAFGAVIFAHGSGSSRHIPRNRFVAEALQDRGLATLLVDLLTPAEERVDSFTAQHRFDIELLTERLLLASDWLEHSRGGDAFRIGYFAASTGAAAALKAAAREEVEAVVSRGGRPDLAGGGGELQQVRSATLLIVGGLDRPVIELNRAAYEQLGLACRRELVIIPGSTHLFDELGALEEVAHFAGDWFERYLCRDDNTDARGAANSSTKPQSIH